MSSVADRVRDVVAPLVDVRGLVIYDLEHSGGVLRVVVQKPGAPVDLDELADLTRAVSRALDDADPISGRYTLEVTSPGLERTLRTAEHFAGAVGEEIKVKTRVEVDGERRFSGVLTEAGDDSLVIREPSGASRRISYDDVERARTVFEWRVTPKKGTPKKVRA